MAPGPAAKGGYNMDVCKGLVINVQSDVVWSCDEHGKKFAGCDKWVHDKTE